MAKHAKSVLLANIQELRETVRNLTEQTTHNINRLAEQAAKSAKAQLQAFY
ncbi:MAG: hypothetical protein PUP92_28085 [Rhizonema sp. PD38]|nr:hypothetical protein [Rhizonema sp. PD38]